VKRYCYYDDSIESYNDVFDKCSKTLNRADFILFPDNEFTPSESINVIDLDQVTPLPNVKTLDAQFVLHQDNSLLYIMHKFPQFSTLNINQGLNDLECDDNDITLDLVRYTTESKIMPASLAKFISYKSTVRGKIKVHAKIPVIANAIAEYARYMMESKLLGFVEIYYSQLYLYLDKPEQLETNKAIKCFTNYEIF
jgi:hypothetical protein